MNATEGGSEGTSTPFLMPRRMSELRSRYGALRVVHGGIGRAIRS